MNSQRRNSLLEVNSLARSARVKMTHACRRPDMDLRLVVGHANFLDHLQHLTLKAHLEVITEAPAPKHTESVKTSTQEVSDEDLDFSDDQAMAFDSIRYSQVTSTVTVVDDDSDSDSNSEGSDTSDDDSPSTYFLSSPSRPPPPQPLTRSKPISIPHSRASETAVEVI